MRYLTICLCRQTEKWVLLLKTPPFKGFSFSTRDNVIIAAALKKRKNIYNFSYLCIYCNLCAIAATMKWGGGGGGGHDKGEAWQG
jgi:hypothetical protein